MTTYTIDQENNVTATAAAKETNSQPGTERFSSNKELVRLAEKWPASRLVDIWNSLPGQTAVKKFTSRKTAVTRIWLAIETGRRWGRTEPREERPVGSECPPELKSAQSPRKQQEGRHPGFTAAAGRSDAGGVDVGDRLAGPQPPRVYFWRDRQKDGTRRRVG